MAGRGGRHAFGAPLTVKRVRPRPSCSLLNWYFSEFDRFGDIVLLCCALPYDAPESELRLLRSFRATLLLLPSSSTHIGISVRLLQLTVVFVELTFLP